MRLARAFGVSASLAMLGTGVVACRSATQVEPHTVLQAGSGTAVGSRVPSPLGCDPIEPSTYCLLPFPDNYFTRPDPHSSTGIRVDLPLAATPKSTSGAPIDPTEWNRNDGFSPGAEVVTQVPGIDLGRTGASSITDFTSSLALASPIVILQESTLQRHPFFAELDANAASTPSSQALILRPTVNFELGQRYIVAMRRLRDSAGRILPPNPAFATLRDAACPPARSGAERTPLPTALAQELPRMQHIFSQLKRAGIACNHLYLAWDFTVASQQNLNGRLLHIRDVAFRQLANAAPPFTVTNVTDFTTAQDPDLARQVTGTLDVPSFLNESGGPPGSRFNYQNGEPAQLPGNVQVANFICDIPRAVASDVTNKSTTVYPAHAIVYGHGLLGSANEVNAGAVKQMANRFDLVICATNEIGMSSEDIGQVVATLGNFSLFPAIPDRLQQGMLDELFLGRLMRSPQGFDSNPAFQAGASGGGQPFIVTNQLAYLGYSQGGILGGVLTAVSTELNRAVLGVPGMNFSTLIDRSTDGTPFVGILGQSYPDKLDQQLIFALIQMLWDRGEPDGYAQNMTNHPLPGTPAHEVLLEEAFGDHQVANITTQTEARTIGAAGYRPVLLPGVVPYDPFAGIAPIPGPGYGGSVIVMWYTPGEPPPPLSDTPPTSDHDPHEDERYTPAAQLQEATFLLTGQFVDTCNGGPCIAVATG